MPLAVAINTKPGLRPPLRFAITKKLTRCPVVKLHSVTRATTRAGLRRPAVSPAEIMDRGQVVLENALPNRYMISRATNPTARLRQAHAVLSDHISPGYEGMVAVLPTNSR